MRKNEVQCRENRLQQPRRLECERKTEYVSIPLSEPGRDDYVKYEEAVAVLISRAETAKRKPRLKKSTAKGSIENLRFCILQFLAATR